MASPSVMAHALWSVVLSKSEQIHLLTIAASLTEIFAVRHQEPEAGQNPWCLVLGPNEAQALDVSLKKIE